MHRDGETVTVLDMVRGKWPAEIVFDRIVATAHADGPRVEVVLEHEKGSSGKPLNESIRRRLAGAGWKGKLHSTAITGSKDVRAFGLAGCIRAGNLWLVEGSWNAQVFIQLDSFPSEEHDDVVDSLSLGFGHLDVRSLRRRAPTRRLSPRPTVSTAGSTRHSPTKDSSGDPRRPPSRNEKPPKPPKRPPASRKPT